METSSFKLSGSEPNAVSIARYSPWRGSSAFKGKRYPALAPSVALLKAWKAKEIPQAEYTQRFYQETLSPLDPGQVFLELGEEALLLCFEAPGEFCHRRLVADWLEEALGIKIPERGFRELNGFFEQGINRQKATENSKEGAFNE
jgi:hypothetical protein